MKRLARCLAGWICKEDDEDLAIYEYGLETGLEMAVFFCIALITAFLTHKVAQIGLLLAIFGLLRSYVGGIHLKNFWSCLTLSLCTVILIVGLSSRNYITDVWCVGIILILSFLIWKTGAVDRAQGKLDQEERKHFQKRVSIILAGNIAVCFLLSVWERQELLNVEVYTLTVIVLSAWLGKIIYSGKERRG